MLSHHGVLSNTVAKRLGAGKGKGLVNKTEVSGPFANRADSGSWPLRLLNRADTSPWPA